MSNPQLGIGQAAANNLTAVTQDAVTVKYLVSKTGAHSKHGHFEGETLRSPSQTSPDKLNLR